MILYVRTDKIKTVVVFSAIFRGDASGNGTVSGSRLPLHPFEASLPRRLGPAFGPGAAPCRKHFGQNIQVSPRTSVHHLVRPLQILLRIGPANISLQYDYFHAFHILETPKGNKIIIIPQYMKQNIHFAIFSLPIYHCIRRRPTPCGTVLPPAGSRKAKREERFFKPHCSLYKPRCGLYKPHCGLHKRRCRLKFAQGRSGFYTAEQTGRACIRSGFSFKIKFLHKRSIRIGINCKMFVIFVPKMS